MQAQHTDCEIAIYSIFLMISMTVSRKKLQKKVEIIYQRYYIDSSEAFIQMNNSFPCKQGRSHTAMKTLDQTLHTVRLRGSLQREFLALASAISHGRGLISLQFCLIRKLLMSEEEVNESVEAKSDYKK